jgi:hypothetical protein
MARAGWCPSGRLFETAACGVPIISDDWPGLPEFYRPGAEILLARDTGDTLAAMDLSDGELKRIGEAGRARTLASHTSMHRARELVRLLEAATQERGKAAVPAMQPTSGQPSTLRIPSPESPVPRPDRPQLRALPEDEPAGRAHVHVGVP